MILFGNFLRNKVISVCSICALFPLGTAALADAPAIRIHNPYSEVNWDTYGTFKAGMHMHTLQSDGFNSVAEVVKAYVKAGFSILSITDHDWNYPNFQIGTKKGKLSEDHASPYPLDPKPENFPANTTWPWTDYGAPSPESLGIVGIEGNELTFRHHVASYFSDYGVWYERTNKDAPFEGVIDQDGNEVSEDDQLVGIAEKGGLAVFCHPGIVGHHRWWDRKSLDWYVDRFQRHGKESLLGIEVTNNKDETRTYDEGLWDQLLVRFMPHRPIWGFGTDDMHRLENTKQSYNLFFLPENSAANVRTAMERGQFVFTRSTRRGMNYTTTQANSPVPEIHGISVDEEAGTIEIDASGWDEIRWITAPTNLEPIDDYKTSNRPFALGEIVETGPRINFRDPRIHNYVRAELIRIEGDHSHTIFTNPFGVEVLR